MPTVTIAEILRLSWRFTLPVETKLELHLLLLEPQIVFSIFLVGENLLEEKKHDQTVCLFTSKQDCC